MRTSRLLRGWGAHSLWSCGLQCYIHVQTLHEYRGSNGLCAMGARRTNGSVSLTLQSRLQQSTSCLIVLCTCREETRGSKLFTHSWPTLGLHACAEKIKSGLAKRKSQEGLENRLNTEFALPIPTSIRRGENLTGLGVSVQFNDWPLTYVDTGQPPRKLS